MPSSFNPRFATLVALYEHAVAGHTDRPLFGTNYAAEME